MSFNSEHSSNSSHQEKLLPWVNKFLAKTRRNRLKEPNSQNFEERTPKYSTPDSSIQDLPQIEHRRDEDGGNALRISMNTDLPTKAHAQMPVESGRIRKISSPTASITRKPISTYMPTGAERVASVERPKEESRSAKKPKEESRSAKNTLQRPPRIEAPTQERQMRSTGITERKAIRYPRDLSPRRNLPRKDVPRQANKPGLSYSSKAQIPSAEPSFMIPRTPRHVPRLPSIDEKHYPGTSPAQHTAVEESPQGSTQSNDATEWGFLIPEGTSFFHSASNSEYSETSDGRDGHDIRDVHDDRDGLSDDYIERILAKNGAIGRGAVRSESEYSQTTDSHRNEIMDHLPGRNGVVGLGVYEDRSESEYSHSEDEQPVEEKRWKPVVTMASESVYPEDEDVRLKRWKQYFNGEALRILVEEEALDEQDLLFEQLLKEVQVDIKDPGYRSEATKRSWWADVRNRLKMDSSDEEEEIKVPDAAPEPEPTPELSPDLSSRERRRREREQHENRRVTMYRATRQRNTERNQARDTIGNESDLWQLEKLLKTLQKKRNRRRGGRRGESYSTDHRVLEEEAMASHKKSVKHPWPLSSKHAKENSRNSTTSPQTLSSHLTHSPGTSSHQRANPSNFTSASNPTNTNTTSPSVLPAYPRGATLSRHASMPLPHPLSSDSMRKSSPT